MSLIRKILEKNIIRFNKSHYTEIDELWVTILFSFHLLDIKNFFKFKNINWSLEFDKRMKKTLMIQYWTPQWHEERGPYVNICIFGLRFMRGY